MTVPQVYRALYGHAICYCPSEGHKHGGRKVTEASVIEFCYLNEKVVTLELQHIEFNSSSRARIVQLAKTYAMTHLLTFARTF